MGSMKRSVLRCERDILLQVWIRSKVRNNLSEELCDKRTALNEGREVYSCPKWVGSR